MFFNYNPFLALISAAIAGLSAFGFYMANDVYGALIAVGCGISFFITLMDLLALSSSNGGISLNVRIVSAIFFIILLIEHIIFSIAGVNLAPYIVITGILVILQKLICYMIKRAVRDT